ncbi:uncharacterized protein TNCV_829661 [Trichonephila clavipes]|nr:uncharacterized protein TNCV_829661 [Trichonephila clavipes]
MFMQKLWRLSIDWKDPLLNKVYSEWHQLLIRLESLNSINIERRIVIENPSSIEIHGFSDASERCYGAAVYCKSKNNSGVTLNRIAKIQDLFPVRQWGNVLSNQNCADLISRGVDPDKLLNHELWWNGPEFLSGSDYPNKIVKISENNNAFVNNARSKIKANGPLEVDELDKVEIFLIKGVQSQEFSVDIKCLQQQRVLPKSKLKSLNPFLESDGVLIE